MELKQIPLINIRVFEIFYIYYLKLIYQINYLTVFIFDNY